MGDESERIWKEEVVALLNVPSQNLLGGTEETHENLSQDSRSLS
jgi:hypothetical protein